MKQPAWYPGEAPINRFAAVQRLLAHPPAALSFGVGKKGPQNFRFKFRMRLGGIPKARSPRHMTLQAQGTAERQGKRFCMLARLGRRRWPVYYECSGGKSLLVTVGSYRRGTIVVSHDAAVWYVTGPTRAHGIPKSRWTSRTLGVQKGKGGLQFYVNPMHVVGKMLPLATTLRFGGRRMRTLRLKFARRPGPLSAEVCELGLRRHGGAGVYPISSFGMSTRRALTTLFYDIRVGAGAPLKFHASAKGLAGVAAADVSSLLAKLSHGSPPPSALRDHKKGGDAAYRKAVVRIFSWAMNGNRALKR